MKDIMGMMKKAQEMQAKVGEMQAELEATEVQGSAGAGMVVVTLTGKGDMRGVKIDPSLLKAEEAEILEDLLIAAHTDARAKAEEISQSKMQEMTAGLPIPPGMKLPF
ncbi:YbaB/EbfC family nucleoid-associated protein [Maritalea porphyrae]|jgi:DNA-binding YbaB/EbfC family protein|uniref:YbaB/EbfC family nucleoid-associated protein n=1 Tax=Maritalea porphyrae TaxID=880732 RepID=UPI0022AFC5B0|nr:YbaB/EbfC family nucleoid-associated protein [Maritalea porphyrae]MCZ4271714.1 YbaB/EbfC family nucleoid-associated protein [Maritalea porphyrae]